MEFTREDFLKLIENTEEMKAQMAEMLKKIESLENEKKELNETKTNFKHTLIKFTTSKLSIVKTTSVKVIAMSTKSIDKIRHNFGFYNIKDIEGLKEIRDEKSKELNSNLDDIKKYNPQLNPNSKLGQYVQNLELDINDLNKIVNNLEIKKAKADSKKVTTRAIAIYDPELAKLGKVKDNTSKPKALAIKETVKNKIQNSWNNVKKKISEVITDKVLNITDPELNKQRKSNQQDQNINTSATNLEKDKENQIEPVTDQETLMKIRNALKKDDGPDNMFDRQGMSR